MASLWYPTLDTGSPTLQTRSAAGDPDEVSIYIEVMERREYPGESFEISDCAPDPVTQFRRWFADAEASGVLEPDAMTLATVHGEEVNARTVALRGLQDEGFVFYTNLGPVCSPSISASTPSSSSWAKSRR